MAAEVIPTLKRILVNDLFVEAPEASIGLDDGLQTTLGLDSISFVELRVRCEEEFGIVIEDDDFSPENFRTLNRLARLIERKRGVAASADA